LKRSADSISSRTSRVKSEILKNAAGKFVDLEARRRIPRRKLRESWVQGVLLGFLEARIGYMELEHSVANGRVDFFHRGNPPSAIELAVAKDKKILHWEHLPAKNKTEIKKLRRLRTSRKLRRFLLLIDLVGTQPIEKAKLKKSYTDYFGKNNFKVTAVYVHKNSKFSFSF
jgi:hypothetical protein